MNLEVITEDDYQTVVSEYVNHVSEKGYQFTSDWFSYHTHNWNCFLPQKFANVPSLNFLEIGSWEGRSTCWLLENVLTHESARITCVDTFAGSVEHSAMGYDSNLLQTIESRFDFNVALTGYPEKVRKIVGSSQEVLRSLPLNSYDLIYIDGSHIASDVLEDAILSWRLLRKNGWMMFDDYDWPAPHDYYHPKIGVDAFLSAFGNKVNILHKFYQVILEKVV
jgi:predicted O-methyltransferase YrrM